MNPNADGVQPVCPSPEVVNLKIGLRKLAIKKTLGIHQLPTLDTLNFPNQNRCYPLNTNDI